MEPSEREESGEPTESSSLGAFAVLDGDSFRNLLRFLHSTDVAALTGCSTALRACCLDNSLWTAMLEREHGPVLANLGTLAPHACARSLFPKARALSSLSTVAWTRHMASVTPREGSACAVVGGASTLQRRGHTRVTTATAQTTSSL